jgi:hypothetical protein
VEIRNENFLKLSRAIKAVFPTSPWQCFLLVAPSKKKLYKFGISEGKVVRSWWMRGIRRRSAAARLLRSWVKISPEA